MVLIRIQKFLSEAGACSRRKAEEYLQQGLIKINGNVVKELGTKVNTEKDKILLKDKRVVLGKKKVYLILNKPKGYVTSFAHEDKKTIKELLKGVKEHLAYAGRLDEDSRGLLFLSNDGDLINKLTHPRYEHEKEYIVETSKLISDFELEKLSRGIILKEGRTKLCKIKRLATNKFKIILEEGWNRQIRRMLEKINHKVKDLQRIRIKNICLGNLKEGKFRYLTETEVLNLKSVDALRSE